MGNSDSQFIKVSKKREGEKIDKRSSEFIASCFFRYIKREMILNPVVFSVKLLQKFLKNLLSNLKTFCHLVFLLVLNFKNMTNTNPKLLKLNQDHTSKDRFFWLNPYKIEVMINSLIKMLELQNFGHMTISAI